VTTPRQQTPLSEALHRLMQAVPVPSHLRLNEPLKNYTTLRVGGPADLFYRATNIEEFAQVVITAHQLRVPTFILGLGSNLLVSDKGIRGLVVYNCCRCIEVGEITFSESGAPFQLLFLKAAQAGLSGLEFAVGIPGTVGGALISNAGAFRENIGDLVETIDVVVEGERQRVTKEWMQFSYRDSILRRPDPPPRGYTGSNLASAPWRPPPDFCQSARAATLAHRTTTPEPLRWQLLQKRL
jgi:UDP-N-acetylmuramate dehydrogenase